MSERYVEDFTEEAQPIPANRIGYDNTTSGLEATTVQGAINELADEKQDKTYDNTTSGLTATTIDGAIDELDNKIDSLDGSDIDYDGTESGLEATNVQGAIDEVMDMLDNNYILTGTGVIEVAGKTWAEFLGENGAIKAVNDFLATLEDDEAIIITGFGIVSYSAFTKLGGISLLKNTDTFAGTALNMSTITATDIRFYDIRLRATNPRAGYLSLDPTTGAPTFIDLSEVTGTRTYQFSYLKYKEV